MSKFHGRFSEKDEMFHQFDPDEWLWNESWFFSWIDLDGGPAGFFRIGVLPNQQRAMLWNFVHAGESWLGREESRLAFGDLDLSSGIAYDKWGLRFRWQPEPLLEGAKFEFDGTLLRRSGSDPGAHVPVSIDLTCSATSECTGTNHESESDAPPYAPDRFEQSLRASGTVTVDGVRHEVVAGAHRDRSWGPREWRLNFTIGDVQGSDRQVYFVGSPKYGIGAGYIREGSGDLLQLKWVDGTIVYDDDARTIRPGTIGLEGPDGKRVDVAIRPIATSMAFDMAHTCAEPEQWLYWRTLIEAKVSGWDGSQRGWFEASRFES
jgi:hypothetical protein